MCGETTDRPRFLAWHDDLLADRAEAIAAAFGAGGAAPPNSRWRPLGPDALTEPVRFLIAHFGAVPTDGYTPDPVALRPALGFINILEPTADGRDFRYRIFGGQVAATSQDDLTGRFVSELPASAYVVDFALASYAAALSRDEILHTVRRPAGTRAVHGWERLVVPFAAPGGGRRLLVGIVPIGDNGLPLRDDRFAPGVRP